MPSFYNGNDFEAYIVKISNSTTAIEDKQADEALATNSTEANDYLRLLEDDVDNASKNDTEATNSTATVDNDDINMLKFTILNVYEDGDALLFPYLYIYLATMIMYISIFTFWREQNTNFDKSGTYKHNQDLGKDEGYNQLHKHCMLVKGIPRHMAPKEARRHIMRILNTV